MEGELECMSGEDSKEGKLLIDFEDGGVETEEVGELDLNLDLFLLSPTCLFLSASSPSLSPSSTAKCERSRDASTERMSGMANITAYDSHVVGSMMTECDVGMDAL